MFHRIIPTIRPTTRLPASRRRLASSSSSSTTKPRKPIDETTMAGAQHKPSLSGPSLGHLISELSATRPGMESVRREGMTMSEEHRTLARRVVMGMGAFTTVLGAGVFGYCFYGLEGETRKNMGM